MSKDDLSDLRKVKLPFDLDEVSPICHECVRTQLKKYEKFVDQDGNKAEGKFLISCRGIKKEIIDPSLKNVLTDEQLKEVEAVNDPVKFAALHLTLPDGKPWLARDYQIPILKCLPGDQEVFMADGTLKRIEDIVIEDRVVSYNDKRKTVETCKVINTFKQGTKKVFLIKLKNGDSLECTEDHPILSHYKGGEINKLYGCKSYITGYQSIADGLTEGSKVYILNKFNYFGNEDRKDLARLLGYFVTDGWISSNKNNIPNRASFANTNKKYVDEFYSLLKSVFPNSNPKLYFKDKCIGKDNCPRKEVYSLAVYGMDNEFIKFLTSIGCTSKHNKEMSILDFAFRFSEEALPYFINRCWSGDGSVYSNDQQVALNLASGNKLFLEKYRLLFKKLGIYKSTIHKDKKEGVGKGVSLVINRALDILCFFDKIGLIYGKEEKSEKAIKRAQKACIPREVKLKTSKNPLAVSSNTTIKGRTKVSSRVEIKSISYIGEKEVYDIEIDRRHNFIARGLIVHNCTSNKRVLRISRRTGKSDSSAIAICYRMFTQENLKVVLAAPLKTHVEEIFNRVKSFIRLNPDLSGSISRSVSNPYHEIKLKNGSRLRGYAIGTKGKSEGVNIRGQDCDLLYIEELDYIDQEALVSAVLPLLQTNSNTEMVGFSTPTGAKTPFYYMCEENPYYKEFHYTYKVLPWFEQVEKERNNYTLDQWTREYLADWTASETNVYKSAYIDKAITNYNYEQFKPMPAWKYCIGTDWNEKFGTEIAVLGFNTLTGFFQVVETVHVERSEFTQLVGVSKLLELNKKWKPSFIYIDAGNGSTNMELLRKKAFDERKHGGDYDTARLLDTLKKYDSGSSVEVNDPISHQLNRAPAKPFMVNASIRLFEQERIKICSSDTTLIKQLRNYIIERTTPSGVNVYGMTDDKIGDHRLDALNLAIVAFHLEFDDLYKTNPAVVVCGPALDPRFTEKDERGKLVQSNEKKLGPTERRLDGDIINKTDLEKQLFRQQPGKLNDPLGGIKTNRLGWDTDQEEERKAEFIQRRKARGGYRSDKPKRDNF